MFGISFSELFIIGIIILIVLGPKKLPEIGRFMGIAVREYKKALEEIKKAFYQE